MSPTKAPSNPSSAAVPGDLSPLHDLQHQISLFREALRSEKRRLGFFLGAGCPLGIYDKDDAKSIRLIPDVAGLTASIETSLAAEEELKPLSECWLKLTAACKSEKCKTPNVEHVLTQLRTICALKGASSIDGMTIENLEKLDTKICQVIAAVVGMVLPEHKNSYHRFAVWVQQLKRIYPLEVFTPNYDLLVEEAFEKFRVPFFDGFVGSREPFFDIASIEQDKVPERWTRLWKLHGSINWIKQGDDYVFRSHPPKSGQQVLIYPSHLKYEQSRRMPYLAMCDRLKAFFQETNPVIVICGYSFADDHLNEVLYDGLRVNRSAHCFALMYSKLGDCKQAVTIGRKLPNLTLLAWDGAVIATRRGSYRAADLATAVGSGMATEQRPGADDVHDTRCSLGDFHHLCLFLETQFGVRTFE